MGAFEVYTRRQVCKLRFGTKLLSSLVGHSRYWHYVT